MYLILVIYLVMVVTDSLLSRQKPTDIDHATANHTKLGPDSSTPCLVAKRTLILKLL